MRSGTPVVPGLVNFQHSPPRVWTALVRACSTTVSRMVHLPGFGKGTDGTDVFESLSVYSVFTYFLWITMWITAISYITKFESICASVPTLC